MSDEEGRQESPEPMAHPKEGRVVEELGSREVAPEEDMALHTVDTTDETEGDHEQWKTQNTVTGEYGVDEPRILGKTMRGTVPEAEDKNPSAPLPTETGHEEGGSEYTSTETVQTPKEEETSGTTQE